MKDYKQKEREHIKKTKKKNEDENLRINEDRKGFDK